MKPKERSRNRTRKLFWCPKLTQNGLNSGCRCCFSDIFHSSSKISGLRERGGNLQSEICGKQECELALLHYCSELLRESGSKERREEAWGHWFVRTSRYFLILPDVTRYHSKFQWPVAHSRQANGYPQGSAVTNKALGPIIQFVCSMTYSDFRHWHTK